MKKLLGSLIFVVSIAGSAWAGGPAPAPAPEMATGVIGMTLAAGVVYLLSRRRRG